MARTARIKIRDGLGEGIAGINLGNGWTAEAVETLHGTVYHCYNRANGLETARPFTEEDKADLVGRLKQSARMFTVELVSWEIMGNHYHVVLFAPAEALSPEAAAERMRAALDGRKPLSVPAAGTPKWLALPGKLRDVSEFIKDGTQKFTMNYNTNRKDKDGEPVRRHGALFDERFKSTVVDSFKYFLACMLYVILNPVRAGLHRDPAESRHGMWGEWCRTGRCPLSERVQALLRLHLGLAPDSPPEALFEAMSKIVRLATASVLRKTGRAGAPSRPGPEMAHPGAGPEEINATFELLSSGALGAFWIRGIALGTRNFVNRIRRAIGLEAAEPDGASEDSDSGSAPDPAGGDADPPLFHTLNRVRCRC